jgi:hypothetical protein
MNAWDIMKNKRSLQKISNKLIKSISEELTVR